MLSPTLALVFTFSSFLLGCSRLNLAIISPKEEIFKKGVLTYGLESI